MLEFLKKIVSTNAGFYAFLAAFLLVPAFAHAETPTPGFDASEVQEAICDIYALMRGAFGALLVMAAGIAAIVAAAFGAYRLAVSAAVVALGCYILPDMVTLFFGYTPECSGLLEDRIDQSMLHVAVCDLMRLVEGSFGALVMTMAGIMAIASAAMGLYQAWYGVCIVGIGAFILRSLLSLYFGSYDTGVGDVDSYNTILHPGGAKTLEAADRVGQVRDAEGRLYAQNCASLEAGRIALISQVLAEAGAEAGGDGVINVPVDPFAYTPPGETPLENALAELAGAAETIQTQLIDPFPFGSPRCENPTDC